MNQTLATAVFSLHVSSAHSSEVWPLRSREDKDFDARIEESYYADEDEASVSFAIRDMDDLRRIMAFYAGAAVRMSLGSTVKAPEFEVSASILNHGKSAIIGTFRALETDVVSPATAANKMIALAHAMQRFESKAAANK